MNQSNQIIFESTTTMHTTTKTTVKVNRNGANNLFESNLDILTQERMADRTDFLKKMRNYFILS
jgi:hypothetical protein